MRGCGRFLPVLWALFVFWPGEIRAFEEGEPLTQGELARKICFISGLAQSLRPPITPDAAVSALAQRGWAPLGGWRVNAYATREDFYVVMCRYLDLRLEGPSDKPESYYQALVAEGYLAGATPTASEATDPSPPRLDEGPAPVPSRVVLEVRGKVSVRRGPDEEWTLLHAYDPLTEGMEVRSGADGEAHLALVRGCSQKIFPDSVLRIKKLSGGASLGDPVKVEVELGSGRTFTAVQPMPAGSTFVLSDPWGKIEVDPAEGSEFRSVVEPSEVLILGWGERSQLMGFEELAPIREGHSRHTNFKGRAIGRHIKGAHQMFKSGESLYFTVGGFRIGPADDFDFGTIARVITGLHQLARNHLLTEGEIRAFLSSLGSGGVVEIHVTPIGR